VRLKLIVCYEGTDFAGFQRQSADKGRTVQGTLEAAISQLAKHPVVLQGASRTDAGVHALGQVVVFDTTSPMVSERWSAALNAHLPADLRVLSAEQAPPSFDPRRHAVAKTYRYLIDTASAPRPIYRRFSLQVGPPLDTEAMAQAARTLTGAHDFLSFSGRQHLVGQRTMQRVVVQTLADGLVCVEMTASGFLYHMARNIAGTLIEVGRHKRPADSMEAILAGRDRALAGHTAAARGLTLVQVHYSDPTFLDTGPESGRH